MIQSTESDKPNIPNVTTSICRFGLSRSLEADGTEKAGDEATADLLTQRMQVHEKTAWMLRRPPGVPMFDDFVLRRLV